MPAAAKLIPKHRERLEALRKAPWELAIPPHLSDTGREQRLFYPTKKEADAAAKAIRNRQADFGSSLTALSADRLQEAAEAYKRLDGSGLRLLEAVEMAVDINRQRRASIAFKELFTQFIDSKGHRSLEYRKELAWTRDRFPTLHNRLATDITARELEGVLAPLTPGARNPVMRYLRAVFNYGIRKSYLTDNPISRLEFTPRPRREVEVLSNAQVEGMLEGALANDLELLPFLVLGLFCGIRPDGELQKLHWTDVHLSERVVVIRSEVSKIRRRRFPELSENAIQWLKAYQNAGGTIGGKLVRWPERELRTRRERNWKAAGITQWVHQGMRHTFCSNWLAVHKDVNKLVLLSGHDSVDTMWRHYHRGTPESEAQAFWSISPPKSDTNIIPFAQQNGA